MARTLSTALLNLLSLPGAPSPSGDRAFVMGDLYEVVSPVLGPDRSTSWEASVTYGGNVYTAGVVIPKRDRVRMKLGLEVDQLEIEIGHGGSAVYGASSQTWAAAALSGALDGSTVKLYRAFFSTAGTLVDAVLLFTGYVGAVEPRSASVRLTVESAVAKLRQQWPKVQIGAGCSWNLYGAGCGVTRPTTWDAQTSGTSALPAVVKVASLNVAADYFKYGTVTVLGPTSSPLYGVSRTIVADVNNSTAHDVTVSPAWPIAPPSGLTVRLTRGCDKKAATCRDTFSNLKRFAGAPMVPPETAGVG